MLKLIIALTLYASAQTGLSIPDHPPHIEMTSTCSLNRDFYEKPTAPCDSFDPSVAALYLAATDTIWLPSEFNPKSTVDQAVLVHELTHWLQDMNGRYERTTCIGDLEKEAYKVQAAFLKSRGLSLFIATGIDFGTLARLTACRPRY